MKKVIFLQVILYSSFLGADVKDIYKLVYYNSLIPAGTTLRERVLTGIFCDDCSYLPRVEYAGKVIENLDGESYQIMHNGIKVFKDSYYGSWMTTLISLLHGHHEPQEEKAFHEVLKYISKDAVMIELGSYWGYYSMWFQKEVPGAQNFLIEPDPKNIEIGKKHFVFNDMVGHFTQAMISDKSESSAEFIDWDYNKHYIPAVSIDDFAAQNDISYIDILHSDIQGAEIKMLQGCSRLIYQKKIGYFFVSTHRGTHDICVEYLRVAGYDILININRQESFSADGLIVAKLPHIEGPSCINISKRTEKFCMLVEEIGNEPV